MPSAVRAWGRSVTWKGRVTGQEGLYVFDGVLIPGTTAGCNPSMTIAAVAGRAMDAVAPEIAARRYVTHR